MKERTIVQCRECGAIYTAQKGEERFIVPTKTTECRCGASSFVDLAEQIPSDA